MEILVPYVSGLVSHGTRHMVNLLGGSIGSAFGTRSYVDFYWAVVEHPEKGHPHVV
jgi:hypothetical protein